MLATYVPHTHASQSLVRICLIRQHIAGSLWWIGLKHYVMIHRVEMCNIHHGKIEQYKRGATTQLCTAAMLGPSFQWRIPSGRAMHA